MDIQTYSEKWAQEITDVFYQSVHAIDPSVYTPEQKEVWAPSPLDYEHWFKQYFALAEKIREVSGNVHLNLWHNLHSKTQSYAHTTPDTYQKRF